MASTSTGAAGALVDVAETSLKLGAGADVDVLVDGFVGAGAARTSFFAPERRSQILPKMLMGVQGRG